MDELSIFIVGDFDWHRLIAVVADALESTGVDSSGGDVLRQQWTVEGFEVIAIFYPKYVDDCGIPFTKYSHQLNVSDVNPTFEKSRLRQYVLFVKSLAQTVEGMIPNSVAIIKNLQSFVASQDSPTVKSLILRDQKGLQDGSKKGKTILEED